MGLIFLILVIGFICFQIGTLFPTYRTRRGSEYYVAPYVAEFDEVVPRWSPTKRWNSNTDHKQWQKQFDALSK